MNSRTVLGTETLKCRALPHRKVGNIHSSHPVSISKLSGTEINGGHRYISKVYLGLVQFIYSLTALYQSLVYLRSFIKNIIVKIFTVKINVAEGF